MLQSFPIQIEGSFVGAAVLTDHDYRFVAVDLRMEPLDQSMWRSLEDLRRVAHHLYMTGRFPDLPATRPVASSRPHLALVASSDGPR